MKAIRKGEIKKATGLVEYVAEGFIEETAAECEIGYMEFNGIYEATHIFIPDQYVGDTHYEAETIELSGSCHYEADDEEV